jgi:hypothetical protein
MTCTFTPWALCLFTGVVRPVTARAHADPVDPQQRAVEDHERFPDRNRDRVAQRWRQRCEDGEGLADVAERGGRADREPGGEIGVGLALAQVGHDEQGLLAGREATPPGPDRGAPMAQRVGQPDEGVVGHGDPRGVGRHPKLLVQTS